MTDPDGPRDLDGGDTGGGRIRRNVGGSDEPDKPESTHRYDPADAGEAADTQEGDHVGPSHAPPSNDAASNDTSMDNADAKPRKGEPTETEVDEAGQPVGVGPWSGPWPDDPRLDPQLLAEGDRRNVVDRYRYWRREAIVADLDQRRHDFHVAIENLQHDFNIGSIVRTANAFLAREVHVVGRRRWNRRGAMVTDRYQHVRHHPDAAALATWAAEEGLLIVGVDNLPGAVPLETYALPRHVVLLFGQEGPGLSEQAHAACDSVVSIAQFGSTRSINAGAAAAIAMHTWIRRYVFEAD